MYKAARVAQRFSTAFNLGPDPGDPGSSPMSGSPHGACMADSGFPTCVVLACMSPQMPTPTPTITARLLPLFSKGHPALAGPPGLLPCPLEHAKFARMVFWLLPAAASKAHPLNASHPTRPQSQLWLHLIKRM